MELWKRFLRFVLPSIASMWAFSLYTIIDGIFVARGVGVCAGIKERKGEIRDIVMTDVCPFTLGTSVVNDDKDQNPHMSVMIERNSVLPTSKEGTYYTARDNQRAIDVKVYQGEQRYCDDNTYLGHLEIAVAPRAPGGAVCPGALYLRYQRPFGSRSLQRRGREGTVGFAESGHERG